MAELPPLPAHHEGNPWSSNIYHAYQIISSTFRDATNALRQEADPIRINYHVETLTSDTVPILVALEDDAEEEGLPLAWLHLCAERIGGLIVRLCQVQEIAGGLDEADIRMVEPVSVIRTGKRGRPRKNIDATFLQEAMSAKRRISLTKLAELLGIHRHTLRYHLKLNNVYYKFTMLSDSDLDALVKTFRQTKPDSGVRYLIGFLRRQGLRLQKRRVTASIYRTDRLGRTLRGRTKIRRRKYNVSRPNYLWHVDGHHKLIHWGFVIHGFIDGYCRTVTGLRASTNNRASTVLDVFLEAIKEYGMPSRLRGDRGGENKAVSVFMILAKGLNRASFMWGSSTHNCRIERLWVEVGSQFVRRWRAFFYRLENLHFLDRKNPNHLWLLHYLFLDMINADCKTFQEEWNVHPISGEGHDQSPNDMRFMGQVRNGMYSDDCEGVHPDVINEYYGVNGREIHRTAGQTGAGHPLDEDVLTETTVGMDLDEDDWQDLEDEVEAAHESNFHHDPVSVPKHANPFPNDQVEQIFVTTLSAIQQQGIVPSGYGLLQEEWDDDMYPSYEIIRTGRGGKELRVALPDFVWRPRAELWGQALDIMSRLTYMTEE